MSRLRHIEEFERFFFVTTNVSRNVPPLRPPEMDLVLDILDVVRRDLGFPLLGYVMMPDHCHLLFEARREALSRIMHQWKFKSGYAVQKYRGHSGALWQPRYFDFICRRARDVSDKLYYMHQNSVVERLASNPEEWRWSSAEFYLKVGTSHIKPDLVPFSGDPNELLWPAPNRL